ncbi:phosphoglycerate mutase [Dyella sp. 2HG41-7]|uniref:phosphoglycerate mutase n=1 Tax=Dyella sp. 2HG41-7 TaxID=2883239 RepID=UPI001F3CF091|nr:phosphoglycerate mutase [Dyella sp. 2HG41-7]
MDLASHVVECWLPDLQRFGSDHPIRTLIRRGDRLTDGAKGYLGGLSSNFSCDGALPVAALTRQHLVGDAGDACWLSADPAWVQPDMSGARLMACGQLLLNMHDARALADALKPIFDDAGMTLCVSSPDRWHLRLPADIALPDFDAPEQALGEDLYEHLPQGEHARTWRMLFNEVQVLLHQHPINTERRERGLPPVNCLWFWGGGVLPPRVATALKGVIADDVPLLAVAQRANIRTRARDASSIMTANAGWLIDLQDESPDNIATTWWPSLQALSRRQSLILAFASGERWLCKPWHRLRVWRRSAS